MDQLIQSNTAFYSDANWQLIEQLKSNRDRVTAELPKVVINSDLVNVPYISGKWPILLQPKRIEEMAQFIQPVVEIMFKALEVCFKHDVEGFCQYLGESESLHQLLFDREKFKRKALMQGMEIIARHDFVYTQGQIKLLEVNAGSNIGGWEFDWSYHSLLNFAKQFDTESRDELYFRPTFPSLLKGMATSIKHLDKQNKTGNMMLRVDLRNTPEQALTQLSMGINHVYRNVPDYIGGEVLICGDSLELSFNDDGELCCRGIRCDAVMLPHKIADPELHQALLHSYLDNKLVFPDSPIHRILGNKMLLALLHDERVLAALTVEQQQWVERYVPKAIKIGSSSAEKQQIIANKDQWVLKKSTSLQGQDVVIGKETSVADWTDKINGMDESDFWVVQQYCEPDEIYLPDDELNASVHTPVWGVFDGGGQYAGSLVRAVANDCESKVINAAIGAKVHLVFET